jgi:hypothetical protein
MLEILYILAAFTIAAIGDIQWYERYTHPYNEAGRQKSLLCLLAALVFGTILFYIKYASVSVFYLPACILLMLSLIQLFRKYVVKNAEKFMDGLFDKFLTK